MFVMLWGLSIISHWIFPQYFFIFLAPNLKITSPFPKQQILDSSKLKEFADKSFEFDQNGEKFSKRVKNTVGKRRNCSLQAISPFPTVFLKGLHSRHVKIRACLGKG